MEAQRKAGKVSERLPACGSPRELQPAFPRSGRPALEELRQQKALGNKLLTSPSPVPLRCSLPSAVGRDPQRRPATRVPASPMGALHQWPGPGWPSGTSGPTAEQVAVTQLAVMDCGRYGKYFVCPEKFCCWAHSVIEN